jgi:hypothetical protein
MTKGLSSSMIRISRSSTPSDPRSALYPYACVVPAKDDDGNIQFVQLFTTSSTLLNNYTRQLGNNADKFENGEFVIDYSFNRDDSSQEEEEQPKKRQKAKA